MAKQSKMSKPQPQRAANGTESAAFELDEAFRSRLCQLVEREMNHRYRRREDPEDIVQSVFRTFFRRAHQGQFQFANSAALWGALKQITRRKILKHVAHQNAQKRDLARERGGLTHQLPARELSAQQAHMLGHALATVLSGMEPAESDIHQLQLFGYTIEEILDIVLKGLRPPYPEILKLRLQGLTEHQIAERVGCGREAVRYRLRRIEQRLSSLLAEQSVGRQEPGRSVDNGEP